MYAYQLGGVRVSFRGCMASSGLPLLSTAGSGRSDITNSNVMALYLDPFSIQSVIVAPPPEHRRVRLSIH